MDWLGKGMGDASGVTSWIFITHPLLLGRAENGIVRATRPLRNGDAGVVAHAYRFYWHLKRPCALNSTWVCKPAMCSL